MRSVLPLVALLPVALLAQVPASTPSKPAQPATKEKRICRTSTETGSLIAAHKECHTAAEWDAQAEEAQRRVANCTNGAGATGAQC